MEEAVCLNVFIIGPFYWLIYKSTFCAELFAAKKIEIG